MSQYDINDPRNPNSPFNMWNTDSPHFNPKQALDQNVPDLTGWPGMIFYGLIILVMGGILLMVILSIAFSSPTGFLLVLAFLAIAYSGRK